MGNHVTYFLLNHKMHKCDFLFFFMLAYIPVKMIMETIILIGNAFNLTSLILTCSTIKREQDMGQGSLLPPTSVK